MYRPSPSEVVYFLLSRIHFQTSLAESTQAHRRKSRLWPRPGHRSKRAQVLLDEWKQFHKWRHLARSPAFSGLRFTIVFPFEWPSKGDFFSPSLMARGWAVPILLYTRYAQRARLMVVLSRHHASHSLGCRMNFIRRHSIMAFLLYLTSHLFFQCPAWPVDGQWRWWLQKDFSDARLMGQE